MARPPRIDFPGAFHHVTVRGVNRCPIFREPVDRVIFLTWLGKTVERHGWRCHAYCLMGNHFHLAVEMESATLGAGMQLLCGSYALGFNRRHGRSGHLFQDRYAAKAIENDSHLLATARYVVLNPVRAGLCEGVEDWLWSSYRATARLERSPSFLSTEWLLHQFADDLGEAAARYRRFVADGLSEQAMLLAAGF
jgi:putative transposase